MSFSKSDAVKQADSLETLARMLDKPGYKAVDNLFIAEVNTTIVGYVNVSPELEIGRVVIDYLFHPAYCTGSLPGDLIERAVQRAEKMGAKAAHVSVPSAELTTIELLSKMGFNLVRRFHELRIDLSKIDLEAAEQLSSVCCSLRPGEEGTLIDIQDRCFTGTWGYDPGAAGHINWWLSLRHNCLEDILLLSEQSDVLGYCWTGTNCGYDVSTGKARGRIYMLGVVPEHRGRGLGRKMLVEGLSYLKNKGRDIVDITVDSENIAAVHLYISLGFRLLENTLWYEKVMD